MFGGLYLGCPQWVQAQWNKSIFPKSSKSRDALEHYAKVFNTVEGNTTFYATPKQNTVNRWVSQTPPSFRFVLKLPQEVTHEKALSPTALEITQRFLEQMSPLGERLSYTLIQLPAHFTEKQFDTLYHFLRALPRQAKDGTPRYYAVELRAPSLVYPQPQGNGLFEEANALLSATQTERVWMDTRPLRATSEPLDEATLMAWQRKPNLPVYPIGLGPAPMVRYVAHPVVEANRFWLEQWASTFAQWLKEGRTPFFFAHYPGETFAPQVAILFYQILREKLKELPDRPLWPSEKQGCLF